MKRLVVLLGWVCGVSSGLAEPVIAPVLDTGLGGEKSTVYCPTLGLVWDRLEHHVDGPVKMVDADPLVAALNDEDIGENVLPQDACVSVFGPLNEAFLTRLQRALRHRFGGQAPALPASFQPTPGGFVSYACLQRSLPFEKKFVRATTSSMEFRTDGAAVAVEYFGVPPDKAEDYGSYVEVVRWTDANDFVLKLSSRLPGESIVLAKTPKPPSLLDGVESVFAALEKSERRPLAKGDLLKIPVMKFNMEKRFPQLCNRLFTNPGHDQTMLTDVYQHVAFKMDEKGAIVRSVADGFGGFDDRSKPREPRTYIFDQPFMLSVWKEGATQPYLAVWVASADVLVAAEQR